MSSTVGYDPAEELAQMMNETLSDNMDSELNNALNSASPLDPANTLSSPPGTLLTPNFNTSRTVQSLQARRLANRYSLGPYSQELETFAGVADDSTHSLHLFARLLVIEQKLANFSTASGSFVVDKALMDNIKSYLIAVLLSPKLGSYKGGLPQDWVLAVIKTLKVNVPANMDSDRHIFKIIKEAVSNELTQARSKIKKAIALSRSSKQSIYQLANTLIENTQCSVIIPLCARLAVLRKVYAEPAKADKEKVQQAFARMLCQDRQIYRAASQQVSQAEVTSTWQASIDNAVAAENVLNRGIVNEDNDGD
ncbi:hypothetical protein FA15DRAFT_709847 [Coprinopsis marcescibilis]|uniref:Uncharacterized protein n=1 Tax=Coprinopsis marcescibilis TaxID=230819 RepID=A0A5C3KFI9_COPMA|nr:hypothetical protein FA15DRAFT_709847 [Coprinopsis marcescibilis]